MMVRGLGRRLALLVTLSLGMSGLVGVVAGMPEAFASGGLVWPATGTVTTTAAEHLALEGARAIDIANSGSNIPIDAAATGTVAVASVGSNTHCHSVDPSSNGLGNYVTLRHSSTSGTTYTTYAHLANEVVSVGQSVSQGQKIGVMGSTGCSTGQHVHFAVSSCVKIWGCDLWNAPDMVDGSHVTQGSPIANSNYPGTDGASADTDGDGVPDSSDKCPTDFGESANEGCPVQIGARFDANGDGRDDLVHRWSDGVNTWLSKGDGTYTITTQQAQAGYGYTDGTWMTADVNGDGRTDLVHRWSDGVNTWLSKGDGTYNIVGQQAQAGYGYENGVWRIGDVNGDGRDDLVHRWSDGVNTWLSKGDGTYTITTQQAQAGYGYTDGTWPSDAGPLKNFQSIPRPTITGVLKVGSVLTAHRGVWMPAPIVTRWQWYRGKLAIAGATGVTYRLHAADGAQRIHVVIVGSRGEYRTVSTVSMATSRIGG
jgi:hypothetical protein